jgi:hypothetical protein
MNDFQNKALINQQYRETVKVNTLIKKYGEIKIRYRSAKAEVRNKEKLLEDYDSRYANLRFINEQVNKDDDKFKKDMYNKERQVETVNKEKYSTKNKYSNTLSKMSVTEKTQSGTVNSRRLKPLTSHGIRTNTTMKTFKLNRTKELDKSGSLEKEKDLIKEKLEKEKVLI